jgi:hypothetical protein
MGINNNISNSMLRGASADKTSYPSQYDESGDLESLFLYSFRHTKKFR